MTNSLSSPLTLLHGLLLAKEKARSPNDKARSPNDKDKSPEKVKTGSESLEKDKTESPNEKAVSPKDKGQTESQSREKDQTGSPNEKAVSPNDKDKTEGQSTEKDLTGKSLDGKTGNDSTLIVHVAGSDVMEMLGIIKWEYILHRLPKVLQRH